MTNQNIQTVYNGFEMYWNFVSQLLHQGVFSDIKKEFLKSLYENLEYILRFSITDLSYIVQKDSKSSASYFGITFLTGLYKFTVYVTFEINNILNVYIFNNDSKIETVHVNQTLDDLIELLKTRSTAVSKDVSWHRKHVADLIFKKAIEDCN